MERRKIPILNEKIDPFILWYIFKKSIIFSAVIFILAIGAALVYLRYTPPLYKASSVIQIKNDVDKTNQILEINTSKSDEVNLNQTIELLRSPEFLKRTFNKLPLNVTYFSQGTFLAFELYRSSPFNIEYQISNPYFYRLPFYVSFIDRSVILKYGADKKEKTIPINKWVDLDGLKLKLNVTDSNAVKEQTEKIKTDSYYFIINDSDYVQNFNSNLLEVFVLNGEANTIQINFTDKNPVKATEIVKTIAEEFINFDVEKKVESSKLILKFIEEQSKLIYRTIDSLEEQLLIFKNSHNISFSTEDEKGGALSKYEQLTDKIQQEIEDVELELFSYNKLISKLEQKPDLPTFELISLIPNSNPIVMSIINKIQTLDDQKELALSSKTPNSFQIKTINGQIEKQRKTLIDLLKANSQRLNDKKTLLIEKQNKYKQSEFGDNALSDLDYLKIKRLYDINVGYYNKLLEKKAEYLISQAGSVSQNIILQNAIAPSEPISPSKKMILVIAIILALLISLSFVVIRYLMYNEITSVEDVQSYTDAKVLGIIPLYKSKLPVSQLLIDIKPNSIFSESFRACRSSIEFIQKDPQQNIISVSSTISGEGKTFFAINLAGIFALQNKRVVLIDLDLRRPRIHIGFNVDNSKGVSTVLIGKNKIEDCIKKSKLPTLDFITAGPIPPNPSELISSPSYDSFIKQLSEKYDFVIIDTPPLGLVSDALTIFKSSHFPVYVMKSHFSKRSFLYNVNHLIDDKKIQNLMILINAFDFEKSKYGNQYGYSYNYGYGYISDTQNHYYEDVPIRKKSFFRKLLRLLGI
ncbi:MAG: polysaccharide biosynthesis tyrosine autokinase [Bacteroidales bacterium]|nr:polysaccharide biosynthesis tyrosine autokinase [Bacteroidales bacterium]